MSDLSDLANVLRAAGFAAQRHRNQRRKDVDASPYINHPLEVANILAVEARITDPAVLCAALLHDTLEDTETLAEDLVAAFGAQVAALVQEVSDDKRLPVGERKRLQIEHAAHLSPGAALVKLADKIANLRDVAHAPPANWSAQRRREYFEWAHAVVTRIPPTGTRLEALFAAAFSERP